MPTVKKIDDPADLRAIAATLPDTPETVIALHMLRRSLCTAYITGTIEQHTALVLDYAEVPGEPSCYGDDPDAIWTILRDLPGWFAPNMRESVAERVGTRIEDEWNVPVALYGDPFFTLRRPAPAFADPAVRHLSPTDLTLLDAAPTTVHGAGFGSTQALLSDGIVAGAIVDNALVAIAHTFAITDQYADISVATLEPFRGRGYATAAASHVVREVQANGRTPVWSCGETNEASLGVARKLGFEPVLRRVYVIVESRRDRSVDVRFPDGTTVRATGIAGRDDNASWRDLGLYCDAAWQPDWPALTIDWPDFGVPSDPEAAAGQICDAWQLAARGANVEVGCHGGLGRTGTVLACMAVLAGVRRESAVGWVRRRYRREAVETREQEDWVLWFADWLDRQPTASRARRDE